MPTMRRPTMSAPGQSNQGLGTPGQPGANGPDMMPVQPPSKNNPMPMPPMASVPPPAQLGPFEPLPREMPGQGGQQPDVMQLLQQLLGGSLG